MPLDTLRIFGNPNIGVYIFANNKVALVPNGVTQQTKKKIEETLNVDVVEARVGGSPLLGIFLAGNDRTILAPKIIRDDELQTLTDLGLNVEVIHGVFTALGNVVLANNKAAMLHPEIAEREMELITAALGVERYVKGTIARIPTVGSAAVVTDVGGIVHPDAEEGELKRLEEFFGVTMDIGTVNFGVAFIKTGLVANNYGALVGDRTTGPEIMRIMKALNMR